jgi:hypothetical protein
MDEWDSFDFNYDSYDSGYYPADNFDQELGDIYTESLTDNPFMLDDYQYEYDTVEAPADTSGTISAPVQQQGNFWNTVTNYGGKILNSTLGNNSVSNQRTGYYPNSNYPNPTASPNPFSNILPWNNKKTVNPNTGITSTFNSAATNAKNLLWYGIIAIAVYFVALSFGRR